MSIFGFDLLRSEISAVETVRNVGRVVEISRGLLEVQGLDHIAAVGDLVEIDTGDDVRCAEILQLTKNTVTILPDGGVQGLGVGNEVLHIGESEIAPDDTWIGRVIDPFGAPLDNRAILRGPSARPLRGQPINPTQRRGLGARVETGIGVFNTFLPIVRGQRVGLFAGSGVGKSTLLAKLAIGIEADVIVIAMIGERGREVREFIERVLGPKGMKRAVIVAATSDQSALVRRRCAWTAMAVAEHFRDSGRHVLFLADSITRFAQAHREVASATGEVDSQHGLPASTTHDITTLCERAGPGLETSGDITAVFSVLVAGSDMEEPIADILRGVLDGHVVLDRAIAERGRFPAVNLLRSVSRSLPGAATEEENRIISKARGILGTYERSEMMIQAGLYKAGSDPAIDESIECWPRLDAFFADTKTGSVDETFKKLQACISSNG